MGHIFIRVEPAVALHGEPQKWVVLMNGVQEGGMHDKSGAGNREFDSETEAREWIKGILHDTTFTWEN